MSVTINLGPLLAAGIAGLGACGFALYGIVMSAAALQRRARRRQRTGRGVMALVAVLVLLHLVTDAVGQIVRPPAKGWAPASAKEPPPGARPVPWPARGQQLVALGSSHGPQA